jgi:hypothetical protein
MSEPNTVKVEALRDPEAGAVWRDLPKSFGIRRRLKLSVEQFAERSCIPVEILRAWEAGQAKPDAVADAVRIRAAAE